MDVSPSHSCPRLQGFSPGSKSWVPILKIMETCSGLGWRDLNDHPIPLPALDRDTFHYPSLLQSLSNLALAILGSVFKQKKDG